MKLNNCPFCNHELDTGDVLDIGRLAFCVHCPKCLAYGPKAKSKEAAIEKWNNRPIDKIYFDFQEGFMVDLCSELGIPYELSHQDHVLGAIKRIKNETRN